MKRIRDQLSKDLLLRHGALLMTASVVSHICNMAFQMVMGRTLSGHEFALLTTLLGFANMAILPMGAISAAVNHSTSLLVQSGRTGDVTALIRKWLVRMGGMGMLVFLVCLLFPNQIASFMHLDRMAPVIIMGFVLCLISSSSVIGGAANGLQMFGVTTTGIQASALVRLAVGAILIHLFAKAAGWGLLGHAAGLGVNFSILFIFLWRKLHGTPKTSLPIPSIRSYVPLSFVALLAFAVLFRADMILVKHYLPADAATFAYATTLGHIVIFLPMPLARAMFPKVVSEGVSTAEHYSVLKKSLFYTAICVVPTAIGCSVAGWLPLRILYGIQEPSRELLHLVSAMGWVMVPVALINIILFFLLAQKKFMQTLPIILCAIGYVTGVALWHGSVWAVVSMAGAATWGCLLVYMVLIFSTNKFNISIRGV